MYEVSLEEKTYDKIVYKSKNELGQVLNMTFDLTSYSAFDYYNVSFWIGKRKNGYLFKQQTGEDGIRSLLWAKKCLIDFMSKLYLFKNTHICVYWDDNKRRNTYERGLRDLGFEIKYPFGSKCLHKLILKK